MLHSPISLSLLLSSLDFSVDRFTTTPPLNAQPFAKFTMQSLHTSNSSGEQAFLELPLTMPPPLMRDSSSASSACSTPPETPADIHPMGPRPHLKHFPPQQVPSWKACAQSIPLHQSQSCPQIAGSQPATPSYLHLTSLLPYYAGTDVEPDYFNCKQLSRLDRNPQKIIRAVRRDSFSQGAANQVPTSTVTRTLPEEWIIKKGTALTASYHRDRQDAVLMWMEEGRLART